MIDTVSVEEIRAAPRALVQPAKMLGGDDVPPVERHAPVLARGAEGVGRRANRRVEAELVLPRPDVGAVAVDHEGQIAEERDAVRLTARRVPLCGRLPLQVLIEQHVGHQLPPGAVDVGGLAALERSGPLGPRAFVRGSRESRETARNPRPTRPVR